VALIGGSMLVVTALLAAQPPAKPRVDPAKTEAVERPTEKIVKEASEPKPPTPEGDPTKAYRVERPAASVVRDVSTPPPPPPEGDRTKRVMVERPAAVIVEKTSPAAKPDVNPKVEPGKVRWHKSLEEACQASKKSMKPVLMLHLMGQLDLQFC
jgi:hypothetical protein